MTLAYNFAKRHGVVQLSDGETATVGLREDFEPLALAEARRAIGRPVAVQRLSRAEFDRKLSEVFSGSGLSGVAGAQALDQAGDLSTLMEDLPATADLLDSEDDAPIIRLINGLLAEAVRNGASDIHVEPFESDLKIRMRIDGMLRETLSLPARLAPLIVSRIKVMARLDIAERRIPQDGRIAVALGGKNLDVRVSTLPSRGGERVVLRVLDREQAGLSLDDLGMDSDTLVAFREALSEPNGIILVTGPTGSGKTTTLYAALSLLNDRSRNILTIEDPVEYAIEGVGQTQVNPKVGMTFAAGLRAILRQDPNVVMVGEIRDSETAQIAVQASLTGHLVLSTVHTNNAVGAVARLRDMGVEPFLLASTLRLVAAQRLVRRLCTACRKPAQATAAEAKLLGVQEGAAHWRAGGCAACNHTGYVGRIGVYEAVRVTEKLRRRIGENATEAELAKAAFKNASSLARAGVRLIESGATSMEEVLRVSRGEGDDG